MGVLDPEATVSSLLVASSQCNIPLVQASFNKEEAGLICNIVTSPLGQLDRQIWLGTEDGYFTVKSAYHLELSSKDQLRGESSTSQ